MPLHSFSGGLDLAKHAPVDGPGPILACALPALLAVPLGHTQGEPGRACVAPGDEVRRGQRIGEAQGVRGVATHAPCAGAVVAIDVRPLPGTGAAVEHVLIEPRPGDDAWMPALDWRQESPRALLTRIADAGLAGLGGAGFPSAGKLAIEHEVLILNGAECEPWISCDHALLRQRAREVVMAGRLLARIIGSRRQLLAVADDMTEALRACQRAIGEFGAGEIELVVVPARYPAGGERQLIQSLLGHEVPRGGLPRDIGVLVHNVATAAAAWNAVNDGRPLTHRIVTVTGPGIARPGNFEVALGTPIAHLVEQAGGYTPQASRLLLGGPMMGVALPHDGYSIGKTSNCVLVLPAQELREPAAELPCIRCGDCASACPARLLPQQLLWQARAGRLDSAVDQGLFDCIECGCCDLVCPSAISLTQQFRDAKADALRRNIELEFAAAARERHLARQQRLVRDDEAQASRAAAQSAQATAADAVAAALERARARRRGKDGGHPP